MMYADEWLANNTLQPLFLLGLKKRLLDIHPSRYPNHCYAIAAYSNESDRYENVQFSVIHVGDLGWFMDRAQEFGYETYDFTGGYSPRIKMKLPQEKAIELHNNDRKGTAHEPV